MNLAGKCYISHIYGFSFYLIFASLEFISYTIDGISYFHTVDLMYFGVALFSYLYAFDVKNDFGKGLNEASK
jgi:hypothetical protein